MTAEASQAVRKVSLRVDGVGKVYGHGTKQEKIALLPASFEVEEGSFVSLVGPSGCGKTTLLKMAAGLVAPSSGVMWAGDQRGALRPGSYGIVFQSPALLPWRTIMQNVLLPGQVLKRGRAECEQRATELLELVKLDGTASSYPGELSGGMQQRAAIARALIHDPEFLLMDEPFGALDAMTREDLNNELQDIHIRAGKTVLFVTHSIGESVLLSDRVLVFSGGPGRLVADVRIDLPRPRTTEAIGTPEWRTLENEIREHLFTGRSAPAADLERSSHAHAQ